MIDTRTQRGVPPSSTTGPFSSAEIAAAEERLLERARLDALAAAAEITASWLAVIARASGAAHQGGAPAEPTPSPWRKVIAHHNATHGSPGV